MLKTISFIYGKIYNILLFVKLASLHCLRHQRNLYQTLIISINFNIYCNKLQIQFSGVCRVFVILNYNFTTYTPQVCERSAFFMQFIQFIIQMPSNDLMFFLVHFSYFSLLSSSVKYFFLCFCEKCLNWIFHKKKHL